MHFGLIVKIHGWVGCIDNNKIIEEIVIVVKGFESVYYYSCADEQSDELVKQWLEEHAEDHEDCWIFVPFEEENWLRYCSCRS